MSKTAFLFPGQGSQALGMMSELAAEVASVRATFDAASQLLGYDLWEVTQSGPAERLNQTEVTQPAMLTAGVATWRAWQEMGGPDPDYVAGHSLGEYSALVAAGALGFEAAVTLAAERGREMQDAAPAASCEMAAILGLDDAVLEDVCAQAAQGQVVSCANFNAPGQIVIAGDKAAVERAIALASAAGARRAVALPVSVASHCALMRPAAEAMQQKLAASAIRPARIPVIHNVDVRPHTDADDIRDLLARQMWSPVRWTATIEWLLGKGVERFAECGPGRVLTGLNKRNARGMATIALETRPALAEAIGQWT
jgi:[acyl-carrier-protein] S-malonyltransferase